MRFCSGKTYLQKKIICSEFQEIFEKKRTIPYEEDGSFERIGLLIRRDL